LKTKIIKNCKTWGERVGREGERDRERGRERVENLVKEELAATRGTAAAAGATTKKNNGEGE
jgi:hypothetical protein